MCNGQYFFRRDRSERRETDRSDHHRNRTPQVNPEQEILKEYFDEQGEGGFDYAYQYPGMNKDVGSRPVIRTVNDKGVIALLDDRFLLPEYVALFPREWERYTVVNRFNVKQAVDDFWGQFV
ncbi:MAG: helicase C-terminal domain-containing protein [Clostridium sp.]